MFFFGLPLSSFLTHNARHFNPILSFENFADWNVDALWISDDLSRWELEDRKKSYGTANLRKKYFRSDQLKDIKLSN